MIRQKIAQHGPMPGSNLSLIPSVEYEKGSEFFRAHSQQYGPWYFSSSMQGRFDLPEPQGTCYLATNPGAAVREVIGDRLSQSGRLPQSLAEGKVISRLPLPLSDAGAVQFPSRFESTLADAATSLGLELYATQSRDLYTFATFTESD